MSKNKDIQVQIEEKQIKQEDQMITIYELKIGKKLIGILEEMAPNKISVRVDTEIIMTVKTIDEGVEAVIRHWNLFQ